MSAPKPRCKPGDLAFITTVGENQTSFLGLLVTVVRRSPAGPFMFNGSLIPADTLPRWRIKAQDGRRGWWIDDGLCPLPGNADENSTGREEAGHA